MARNLNFRFFFQPYEDVYITIDDQDFNIVNRLINAIYFGQATVTNSDRKELESLLSLLKVKIDLTADSSESSEEEESKNKANGEKIILRLSCSECTLWNFENFSTTQIFRLINFGISSLKNGDFEQFS